jgi:hypothetical protein
MQNSQPYVWGLRLKPFRGQDWCILMRGSWPQEWRLKNVIIKSVMRKWRLDHKINVLTTSVGIMWNLWLVVLVEIRKVLNITLGIEANWKKGTIINYIKHYLVVGLYQFPISYRIFIFYVNHTTFYKIIINLFVELWGLLSYYSKDLLMSMNFIILF